MTYFYQSPKIIYMTEEYINYKNIIKLCFNNKIQKRNSIINNILSYIRQDYLEIKSQCNFNEKICDIIEIFSLDKLFRYSKLTIIDTTKTKKICKILQNPSDKDDDIKSNYNKIINELIAEHDDDIHSINIINLFARIDNNIESWKDNDDLITQDEKNNMIYIKNNVFNNRYDEYYLGYGQHIQYICPIKKNIFRPIYCKFLEMLLSLENIIMKKYHSEYCKIDKKFDIPGYPYPKGNSKLINISIVERSILKIYYDKHYNTYNLSRIN